MNPTPRLWGLVLTAAAENDIRDILRWTEARFGVRQMRVYERTLSDAVDVLIDGPAAADVRARDEIRKGLFTLHVARGTRRGRHFVMFRIDQDRGVIEALRVLHDSMDLARYMSG